MRKRGREREREREETFRMWLGVGLVVNVSHVVRGGSRSRRRDVVVFIH